MRKMIFFLMFSVYLYAQNIGYQNYSLFSKNRDKNINAMLFYPSIEKEDFVLGKHKLFMPENVSLGGKIKKGKYPLLLLSHGGLRSSLNQINWLAKNLAKEGFIVLLTRSNLDKKFVLYEPWFRANDIYIAFEKLKNDKKFKNSIDFENINSVGFLLGASSLILSSSAKINYTSYKNQCSNSQSLDCAWYEKSSINLDSFDKKIIKDIQVSLPIKKAVLFDTEHSKIFDKNSLKSSKSDFYFINLSNMKALDNSHFNDKYKYEKIKNTNAFSSFSLCTNKGELILKGTEDNKNICFDNNSKKKVIHEIILNRILEYFKEKS